MWPVVSYARGKAYSSSNELYDAGNDADNKPDDDNEQVSKYVFASSRMSGNHCSRLTMLREAGSVLVVSTVEQKKSGCHFTLRIYKLGKSP